MFGCRLWMTLTPDPLPNIWWWLVMKSGQVRECWSLHSCSIKWRQNCEEIFVPHCLTHFIMLITTIVLSLRVADRTINHLYWLVNQCIQIPLTLPPPSSCYKVARNDLSANVMSYTQQRRQHIACVIVIINKARHRLFFNCVWYWSNQGISHIPWSNCVIKIKSRPEKHTKYI